MRLDIHAVDLAGKHYNIEIRRDDRGAGERRARFNSSMLDAQMLQPGQELDELADAYVIFLTEHDIRGQGRPIYRFGRTDLDTHELFDDGSHILYVNGAYRNDQTPIGQLMHDFHCTEAGDMHHEALAKRVRYFKETEGGQSLMCRIMEDIHNEGREEGREEGRAERNIEVARDMLRDGVDLQTVAKYSRIPPAELQLLAEQL